MVADSNPNGVFWPHYCPGFDLRLQQKWVPGIFLGGKRPMRRPDTLASFMCRLSESSGNLNILEPSGSILACTRRALPNTVHYKWKRMLHKWPLTVFQPKLNRLPSTPSDIYNPILHRCSRFLLHFRGIGDKNGAALLYICIATG